ncbi:hypothetical protein ACFP3I_08615 [Chryseobacterium arachidis]
MFHIINLPQILQRRQTIIICKNSMKSARVCLRNLRTKFILLKPGF